MPWEVLVFSYRRTNVSHDRPDVSLPLTGVFSLRNLSGDLGQVVSYKRLGRRGDEAGGVWVGIKFQDVTELINSK